MKSTVANHVYCLLLFSHHIFENLSHPTWQPRSEGDEVAKVPARHPNFQSSIPPPTTTAHPKRTANRDEALIINATHRTTYYRYAPNSISVAHQFNICCRITANELLTGIQLRLKMQHFPFLVQFITHTRTHTM